MQGPQLVVYTGGLPLIGLETSTYRWLGPKFSSSTTKLVWNVSSFNTEKDVDRRRELDTFHWGHLNKTSETEMFFVSISTVVFNFTSSDPLPFSDATLTRFIRSITYVWNKHPETVIKLIDFNPHLLRKAGDSEKQETVHRQLVSRLARMADRVSFLTSDDYRGEVGDQQFEFETSDDLR
jgi:hypothetical protein